MFISELDEFSKWIEKRKGSDAMEHIPLTNLTSGQLYRGVWRVQNFIKTIDRSGHPMARFDLSDQYGKIKAVFFEATENILVDEQLCTPDGFAQVSFTFENDPRYGQQAKVSGLKGIPLSMVEHPEELIPAIADRQKNYEALIKAASGIQDEAYQSLVLHVLKTYEDILVDLPAAKSMHHDVLGGWCYHTLMMARTGAYLCRVYGKSLNYDLLLSGIILHDLGKMQEFVQGPSKLVSDYSVGGVLLSHLILGILLVEDIQKQMAAENLPVLDENKKLALYHIIESHHGKPEYGSAVTPKFTEAMVIHYLDQIDAKIWMFNAAKQDVEPGKLSDEKIFGLDGRIWKPDF